MIGQELTLLEVARRLDPNGEVAAIAEVLTPRNEILDDMPWIEGNLPTGHKSVIRGGIPEPTMRAFNYPILPTKSETFPVTDACGMMENYSEVDKGLADLNGNTKAFRVSEDIAIIGGFNKKMATKLFYGNPATDPKDFGGFMPRFSSKSAGNGAQIIDAGGGGNVNASVLLVGWGPETAFGIYPKGSKAGISMSDRGQVTIQKASGQYEGYRTHYKWDAGLVVKDWRYVVRGQVKYADLTKDASTGADLVDMLVQMLEQIEDLQTVRPAFYMGRTLRAMLRRQILNKDNVLLSMEEIAGRKVLAIDGVPIRRSDALVNTEAHVTA